MCRLSYRATKMICGTLWFTFIQCSIRDTSGNKVFSIASATFSGARSTFEYQSKVVQ